MIKLIPGYEHYAVDELGNVYSVRKNYLKLIPKHNHDGYLRIQLWNHQSCKFVGIHRLVAIAFIPNPDNKPFINHKNGIKSDNRVENLEWCTQKENIKHSYQMGLSHKNPLNFKPLSKPIKQYDLQDNFIKEFPSTMEVERILGIKHSQISYACKHNGIAKGYKWKYSKTSND